MKLVSASQEIKLVAYSARDGLNYPVPRSRIMDLGKSKDEFEAALIGFIGLIERRQFIEPEILIFRTALQTAKQEAKKRKDELETCHIAPRYFS